MHEPEPGSASEQLPERVTRWRGELDEIHADLQVLADRRQVWKELNEIVDANPVTTDPRDFYDWLTDNYVVAQAIGLRRHAMSGPKQVTLAGLLIDVELHAADLDFAAFCQIWEKAGGPIDEPDPIRQRLAEHHRERTYLNFATSVDDTVDRARVGRDRNQMLQVLNPLEAFANNWLAHLQVKRHKLKTPTFGQLDDGLAALEGTYIRYRSLLTAESWMGLAPVRQHDWRFCFREAWRRPT